MTTWDILVGNSTLPDNGVNTSWQHLNNQAGGGGAPYPVYIFRPDAAESITLTEAESITTTVSTSTTATEASASTDILTATSSNITSAETQNG